MILSVHALVWGMREREALINVSRADVDHSYQVGIPSLSSASFGCREGNVMCVNASCTAGTWRVLVNDR